MLFNSTQYLFFYLAILALSWLFIKYPNPRRWLILAASFYFYFSNNGWLILLLLVCMQIDYFAALIIEKSQSPIQRRLCLLVSMTANLCMLGFFKYFNFFCSSLTSVFNLHWQPWNILLPVGISFYTFESMSYTIDVYRGIIPAQRYWHKFALFVAYFPHLIAGPILRPKQFLPQLERSPFLDQKIFESAIFKIVRGLFKKIALADFLASYVVTAFDKPGSTDWFGAWIGVFAFAFQIYYDFSGYSDIAIGCARLMGFEIPENFNRPYASSSITEFWKRWHISLSSWLRDYLYIPLGGSRMKPQWGIYRNLFITMLLGGLWHGAAWHFVLWGGLHGLLLSTERLMRVKADVEQSDLKPWYQIFPNQVLTFLLATLCWTLFRSQNLTLFAQLWQKMFSFGEPLCITNGSLIALAIIITGIIVQLFGERLKLDYNWLKQPIPIKSLAYAIATVAIIIGNSEGAKPFIYFQF